MMANQGLVLTRADRNCTPVAQCSGLPTRELPRAPYVAVPQSTAEHVNAPRAEERLRRALICGDEFRKLRPQYTSSCSITDEGMYTVLRDGDRVIYEMDTRKPGSESERTDARLRRGGRIVI